MCTYYLTSCKCTITLADLVMKCSSWKQEGGCKTVTALGCEPAHSCSMWEKSDALRDEAKELNRAVVSKMIRGQDEEEMREQVKAKIFESAALILESEHKEGIIVWYNPELEAWKPY
jgi:hypothetical protein